MTGNNMTRGVRIDPREQMLYWVNRDAKKVHRCPLSAVANGPIPLTHPAVQTLYTNLDTPHGLTLDIPARKIYWADTGTNPGEGTGGQSICRGDFDGSTPLEILATGTEPWDVDLDLRCASYAEWSQRCFRRDAPPAVTAPDADPDGDGLPNAAEYAFDLSPGRADRSALPASVVVTGAPGEVYHAVQYRRRVGTGDLQYKVQVSTNLNAWAGNATLEIQVTTLADGVETATARTLYTVSGLTNHFLRVQTSLGQ